ncbi:DUF4932 domain-containing protein [Salinimicrobium sp. HB62]|uniref:DUF4932 domain-containing protein n=1 Tax=Salinimicrobium sp. HB62 TaxID=3077781 RepID=UPI002D778EF3|nr:DUF4932 domain-containing protein [Salinimicrobium sp. HB62]
MRLILFFPFFILFLNTGAFAAEDLKPYDVEVNGVNYTIDPRIELFNIIAMQFGHSGMTLSNIPYKKDILDRFSPWKDHAAPTVLRETWQKGWGVDDPMFFLLHLDEDLRIKENMPAAIIERGGGMEQLEKLASAFQDYAEVSGFRQFFYKEQKDFYQQVLSQTRYTFRDFEAVDLLEDFFGKEGDKYTVILNLISNYGNFGKIIESTGRSEFYAIVETNKKSGGIPVFEPTLSLQELILHEFSHGFVNPEMDEHSEALKGYEPLYSHVENAMKQQGYHNWMPVVNEHVVRAAVLEMMAQHLEPQLVEQTIYKKEMGRQFLYLDKLREKLRIYQQNRTEFPTFKTYVPELITAFSEITPDYLSQKTENLKRFLQPEIQKIPKPYEFARDSTTLFVVGTHETDKAAQKKMHAFAEEYKNMFSEKIQLVTDEQAFLMDLENYDLVLFGTVEGNLLLKDNFHELPISISEKGIYTNKFIEGENLQLVSSWVSPYNADRVFVVYTAQNAADINNFYRSMHKDQFHYWVAQDLITLEKGDYKKYWNVWIPDILKY